VTRRRWVVVAVAALAVVLVVGRIVASLYVDYRWYEALGAGVVWRSRTLHDLALRGLSATLGTAFILANLWAVRRSVVSLVMPRRLGNLDIGEEVPPRYIAAAVVLLSILLGGLLTLPQESWTTLGLWHYGQEFGEADPYFSTDLGFYVYWLPLETAFYVWAIIALVLAAAVVIFLYALTPSLRWERGTLRASSWVRRHLTVLGVLLLLLLAWSYRLDAYATLASGSGPGGTFTAVDRTVVIPANLGLAALTLAISLLVLWAGWTGQMRVAFAAVTSVIVLSVALRQALPGAVRRFGDAGAGPAREAAYLATGLSFTRRAYAADRIALADSSFGYDDLTAAARLVPVWDTPVLTRLVDRAAVGGAAEPVVSWHSSLSAVAEGDIIVRPSAAEGSGPLAFWTLVRVLGQAADDRGGPVRANSAGQASDEFTQLLMVHFADSIGGFVVVSDSAGRLPASELDSWTSRLAHAWSRQDWRLLFGDLPRPSPRILLRRGVRERVRAVAPFFVQDRTLTPVVYADSLYWLLHVYSASRSYPLSQRLRFGGDEWNYFQHAATAVVNAHTGHVSLVADSLADPIAQSWRRAFPALFTEWTSLPSGLDVFVPPALDGAYAQARALARCNGVASCSNVAGPPALLRVVGASALDTATSLAGEPLFVLPSVSAPVAWSVPLTGPGERVQGIVVASGGAAHRTWWRPAPPAGDVPWPSVASRLQGPPDSAALTLPGMQARLGRIRAVPVAGSIAYVQPHYVTRADGVAALTRVGLLADGGAARFGRTLLAAIGGGGGSTTGPGPATGVPTSLDFRARVAALYDAMQSALRRGDLAAFGAAYRDLGALIHRR